MLLVLFTMKCPQVNANFIRNDHRHCIATDKRKRKLENATGKTIKLLAVLLAVH